MFVCKCVILQQTKTTRTLTTNNDTFEIHRIAIDADKKKFSASDVRLATTNKMFFEGFRVMVMPISLRTCSSYSCNVSTPARPKAAPGSTIKPKTGTPRTLRMKECAVPSLDSYTLLLSSSSWLFLSPSLCCSSQS